MGKRHWSLWFREQGKKIQSRWRLVQSAISCVSDRWKRIQLTVGIIWIPHRKSERSVLALNIGPFRWVKYSPIFESYLAPLNQQFSVHSPGTVLTVTLVHLLGSLTKALSGSIIFYQELLYGKIENGKPRLCMQWFLFALRAPQVTERLVLIIYPIPNAKQLKHFLMENFLSVKNWRIKLIT